MVYSDLQNARSQVQKLMDIASTLADYTQSTDLAVQIPGYLARSFGIEPITLLVVRQVADAPAEIALVSSSTQLATGEAAASFNRQILEIHHQTRPLKASDAPVLRSPFADNAADASYSEMAISGLTSYPRALVFARTIDDSHRMCIILHQRANETLLSPVHTEAFTLVANQLVRLLRCLFAWQDRPQVLGSEFERLTDREWVVLRSLNSDDGEKQLADRLSLSPHTLHSHIKSIYRKVGVQGRLPLLLRLNTAIRELRQTSLNGVLAARAEPENRAVAVG